MPQAANRLRQIDIQRDQYRKQTQSWYNTSRWRTFAKKYKQLHPYCCKCKPVLVRTYAVDHITPHKGDYDLFWAVENMQPLCQSCHNKKTREEQG